MRTRLLGAFALVALLGAGCSSGAADDVDVGAGNGAAAVHEQAVAFATCMRGHGVVEFPDPEPSGELTIDAIANGSSVDAGSATFEQALTACKDLQPAGFTGPGTATPEQQDQRLAFAQCMRDNGVADFPDPAPDAPLVDTNLIPSSGTEDGMSMLNAAMDSCGDLVADLLTGP